ncbi:MAG TPA: TolC family protein, partial [Nannocystis sp.]
TAARRWQTLRGAALPASVRAREVALSGYEVGRADMLGMLAAEGAYVEISLEIIDAKAALDHALAELERAGGDALPRTPLLPTDPHTHRGAR